VGRGRRGARKDGGREPYVSAYEKAKSMSAAEKLDAATVGSGRAVPVLPVSAAAAGPRKEKTLDDWLAESGSEETDEEEDDEEEETDEDGESEYETDSESESEAGEGDRLVK
jgi:AP-3 complex subunit beta